jgi:hypothetical protein
MATAAVGTITATTGSIPLPAELGAPASGAGPATARSLSASAAMATALAVATSLICSREQTSKKAARWPCPMDNQSKFHKETAPMLNEDNDCSNDFEIVGVEVDRDGVIIVDLEWDDDDEDCDVDDDDLDDEDEE